MTTLELFTMAIFALAFAVFASLLIKAKVEHLSLTAEIKKTVSEFEGRLRSLESSNTVTTVVTTSKLQIVAPTVELPAPPTTETAAETPPATTPTA